MAPKHLMIVVTEQLTECELIEELRQFPAGETRIVIVAPAVEDTVFQHALGDFDTARRNAQRRLDVCLEELRRRGVPALGEVGPSDPVLAAVEALRQYPADEVIVFTHPPGNDRWYEQGLYERACRTLRTPVRLCTPAPS